MAPDADAEYAAWWLQTRGTPVTDEQLKQEIVKAAAANDSSRLYTIEWSLTVARGKHEAQRFIREVLDGGG